MITCFVTTASIAQKSKIQDDIQGTWKLSEILEGGARVNLEKSELALSKSLKGKATVEQRKDLESRKAPTLKTMKTVSLVIKGNTLQYTVKKQVHKGTFTLEPYSGFYYLMTTKYTDGGTANLYIFVKNKKLIMREGIHVDSNESVFIR